MNTKLDKTNPTLNLVQQQDNLLHVLSKYFEPDKADISFQSICEDVRILSGASFCILNTFNEDTGLLKTSAISRDLSIKKEIITLMNIEWQKGSFIAETVHSKDISESASQNILAEYGLSATSIFFSGLHYKANTLGSLIFGFENDCTFESQKSISYFLHQAEKIIPSIIRNQKERKNYFKDSEVIRKNDTDLVFVVDRELCVIDTNTNTFPVKGSGFTVEAMLNIVPDNLKNAFSKKIARCFDTGFIDYEEIPLDINGSEGVFYAIKFIPIKKGEVVESLCIIATDTEEQKHILRDFNILQNFAEIGWWELHLPSNKLLWSEGLYRLMELDPEFSESSDELYSKYIHPDDLAFVDRTYKRALKDEKAEYEITYRLLMKDGRIKWVTDKCITYFDDQGKQYRSLGIIQDITQLKRAEIKLKKINGSYKRLNDQVPGIIFEYQIFETGERQFNSISEKAVKSVGVDAETLRNNVELAFGKILPADLAMMKVAFSESARTLKSVNVDYRIIIPEEENRISWKRLEASPEKQEDNSRIWYGYISEIDYMKEAQLKILEAKEEAERANKAKTEFLANMSHEIRTPLNAVLGFSELLKGNTTGPKYESYINGILAGGKNLLSLIDDILDLSKIEAGQMNIQSMPVNLENLANEFKQMFAQKASEKGIDFIITCENGLPKNILIDETRIRQVLFNLIGNALKFTHQGSVTLAISALEAASDNSKISLLFKISDTGIGIAKNQHQLIFESFKQQDGQSNRKYGGTGLGLAITKRLVDMMNGTIQLESSIGKGSCFSVAIHDINVASMEEEEEHSTSDVELLFKGQKILLVEDVHSNREIIKGFLEPLNLKISIAENGQDALNSLKSELPDLILMDMMMPVMDGYTAVKIIRCKSNYNKIPIIALTASALKQSELEIRELCNDYLRKPVSKKDLIAVLSTYLSHTPLQQKEPVLLPKHQDEHFPHLSEELKQELRSLFLPAWNDISKLMSIDDIVGFTTKLASFASQANNKALEIHCKHLLEYAENFDIEKMNTSFYEINTLMKETPNE